VMKPVWRFNPEINNRHTGASRYPYCTERNR
jgi:hypothetical protein